MILKIELSGPNGKEPTKRDFEHQVKAIDGVIRGANAADTVALCDAKSILVGIMAQLPLGHKR